MGRKNWQDTKEIRFVQHLKIFTLDNHKPYHIMFSTLDIYVTLIYLCILFLPSTFSRHCSRHWRHKSEPFI